MITLPHPFSSQEIRERFLKFFEKRGHAILPSAPLVPENDPSVLFNTAGMQPLVPYLLGEKHPGGMRLANAQKCARTTDIESIGDATHATFFEMLGHWSLGDYFKEDAIRWGFEFLTSQKEGIRLRKDRLYVTVFGGNDDAPRDAQAFEIWKQYVPEHRIYFMRAEDNEEQRDPNWWSAGESGPCGPDAEIFYDITPEGLGNLTKEQFMEADKSQKVVEIWNDVFMEYVKKDGKVVGKLDQKNVDTGSGLERVAMAAQGKNTIFETDMLKPIVAAVEGSAQVADERAVRIVADHMRTGVFLIADGVLPSNTDQGYVLRRLIRRAVRYADMLGLEARTLANLVSVVADMYKMAYPEIGENRTRVSEEIRKEEEKFRATLKQGLREFENGRDAFTLFQSYGFPLELTLELAKEKGMAVDTKDFEEKFEKHQEISRAGAERKFKGGLADHSEMSVKYHTATHLLHQALRVVLGEHVFQRGSNITPERLRFDFSHNSKMTAEEMKKTEELVNAKIAEALPVSYEDISLEEAKKRGAIGLFGEKYGDKVRVYRIGDGGKKFSLEFCGGPHVKNTRELGHFRIAKEEAVSLGVRRIKAVLE